MNILGGGNIPSHMMQTDDSRQAMIDMSGLNHHNVSFVSYTQNHHLSHYSDPPHFNSHQ